MIYQADSRPNFSYYTTRALKSEITICQMICDFTSTLKIKIPLVYQAIWISWISLILVNVTICQGQNLQFDNRQRLAQDLDKIEGYYKLCQKIIKPHHRSKTTLQRENQFFQSFNNVAFHSLIYDINGREIAKLSAGDRIVVSLKEISPSFLNAVLAIEDQRFYQHQGIDTNALKRAAIKNIKAKRIIQGGSTITQQLVKQLCTDQKRVLQRKVYEYLLVKEIEQRYTKNDILFMYVNYVYFAHKNYGVEAAANYYFDKKAKNLTIAESTLLAGIIAAPAKYSPIMNPKKAKARHLRVLKALDRFMSIGRPGIIGDYKRLHQDFWQQYHQKRISIEKRSKSQKYALPNIRRDLKQQLIKTLIKQLNINRQKAIALLYTRGWKIYTTIDFNIQKKAEKTISQVLTKLRKLLYNKNKVLFSDLENIQGVLLTLNPKNGFISAMVNGDNQRYPRRAFNHKRSLGGLLRPLCYLAASDNGLTAVKHKPAKQLVYHYGNAISTMIGQSLNLSKGEVERRFNTKLIQNNDLTMSPYEVTRLYAMLANCGQRVKTRFILKIKNMFGEVIDLNTADSRIEEAKKNSQIVSKKSACMLIKMLLRESNSANSYKKLNKSFLDFDMAVLNVSTEKFRDYWLVGFSPELCTVIWLGHDNKKSLLGIGQNVVNTWGDEFLINLPGYKEKKNSKNVPLF